MDLYNNFESLNLKFHNFGPGLFQSWIVFWHNQARPTIHFPYKFFLLFGISAALIQFTSADTYIQNVRAEFCKNFFLSKLDRTVSKNMQWGKNFFELLSCSVDIFMKKQIPNFYKI